MKMKKNVGIVEISDVFVVNGMHDMITNALNYLNLKIKGVFFEQVRNIYYIIVESELIQESKTPEHYHIIVHTVHGQPTHCDLEKC